MGSQARIPPRIWQQVAEAASILPRHRYFAQDPVEARLARTQRGQVC